MIVRSFTPFITHAPIHAPGSRARSVKYLSQTLVQHARVIIGDTSSSVMAEEQVELVEELSTKQVNRRFKYELYFPAASHFAGEPLPVVIILHGKTLLTHYRHSSPYVFAMSFVANSSES